MKKVGSIGPMSCHGCVNYILPAGGYRIRTVFAGTVDRHRTRPVGGDIRWVTRRVVRIVSNG